MLAASPDRYLQTLMGDFSSISSLSRLRESPRAAPTISRARPGAARPGGPGAGRGPGRAWKSAGRGCFPHLRLVPNFSTLEFTGISKHDGSRFLLIATAVCRACLPLSPSHRVQSRSMTVPFQGVAHSQTGPVQIGPEAKNMPKS